MSDVTEKFLTQTTLALEMISYRYDSLEYDGTCGLENEPGKTLKVCNVCCVAVTFTSCFPVPLAIIGLHLAAWEEGSTVFHSTFSQTA